MDRETEATCSCWMASTTSRFSETTTTLRLSTTSRNSKSSLTMISRNSAASPVGSSTLSLRPEQIPSTVPRGSFCETSKWMLKTFSCRPATRFVRTSLVQPPVVPSSFHFIMAEIRRFSFSPMKDFAKANRLRALSAYPLRHNSPEILALYSTKESSCTIRSRRDPTHCILVSSKEILSRATSSHKIFCPPPRSFTQPCSRRPVHPCREVTFTIRRRPYSTKTATLAVSTKTLDRTMRCLDGSRTLTNRPPVPLVTPVRSNKSRSTAGTQACANPTCLDRLLSWMSTLGAISATLQSPRCFPMLPPVSPQL